MKKAKDTTKTGFEIAGDIVKYSLPYYIEDLKEDEEAKELGEEEAEKLKELQRQLKSSLAPHVANALYRRDKEVLENERFQTMMSLARVLNDKQFAKAMRELGYSVGLKEDK